jgi:hypothetical protein
MHAVASEICLRNQREQIVPSSGKITVSLLYLKEA